jgi:hypothetical protein
VWELPSFKPLDRLDGTYNKVPISKHLSDAFPVQNCLKEGNALLSLLFSLALEYAIRKIQDEEELILNGIHHVLIYADDDSKLAKIS